MTDIPQILKQYIQHGKVFVFSTTNCSYCDRAKGLLEDLGVKFDSYLVDEDKETEEFVKTLEEHSKIDTYPKIYIGAKCIGGFTDLNKLFETMKIFDILDKEGISHYL